MNLKSAAIAMVLILSLALPVPALGAENVALEVGVSDLYVSVPLCTYWYSDGENQMITPVMSVTNNGFIPLTVSDVLLPGSRAEITGIPCEIAPSMREGFVLTENPRSMFIQKRVVKQAVIFTISKIGG